MVKRMIVVADAGSSKTAWSVISAETGAVVEGFVTAGINPAVMGAEELRGALAEAASRLAPYAIEALHFYGAGCLPELCGSVAGLLASITGALNVEVASDLLGAARALLGSQAGIACILGTGSNSCLYDGQRIVDNVSPLGYILGDEGSGAVLGKLLVGDVLKRRLPSWLSRKFLDHYELDAAEIIRRVYRSPGANRFLASFAPFIAAHIEVPEVHRLVMGAFTAFLQRNVANYPDYRSLPLAFCGSIAAHFSSVLAEAAAAEGCVVRSVTASPMEGLIAFHTQKS